MTHMCVCALMRACRCCVCACQCECVCMYSGTHLVYSLRTLVSSPPSVANGLNHEKKQHKINVIIALSCLTAELLLCNMWQVTCCM